MTALTLAALLMTPTATAAQAPGSILGVVAKEVGLGLACGVGGALGGSLAGGTLGVLIGAPMGMALEGNFYGFLREEALYTYLGGVVSGTVFGTAMGASGCISSFRRPPGALIPNPDLVVTGAAIGALAWVGLATGAWFASRAYRDPRARNAVIAGGLLPVTGAIIGAHLPTGGGRSRVGLSPMAPSSLAKGVVLTLRGV